ncbi:hypothetical protein A2477_03285 [Candidatus Falkowbacteria bacterium RIFOXYC2_FULL_47_12]|uniref:TrpR, YerC/YecD n=2 Tax=Candidatus Falkowiibacteriota TaxID=1752728 RepID=A0A1F5TNC8_9BACT|nr:MAG: hypothetical protein A2242_03525 [Candidatus Falkowbacteria bacterium RIFOXYA2_FULL_47_9]OGF40485.1 MAG: hypothetical protein A2477_03285 [Candidatus Falkowbacteria bacterium RIFOXYC2_FULL_47_12]
MNLNTLQINSLVEALLTLKNQAEMKKFLRDLLTEAEINEFARRWQAAQMLDQKVPYSIIIKKTGLSSTTVARISKWLNNGAGGYRLVLNTLHHHRPALVEKDLS